MAKITINGTEIKVKKGTTILSAAERLGIQIPTLCFMEEINEIGFCRVCVVEVEGEQDLVSACNTEVTNGMVIETESKNVLDARKTTLALLATRHRFDCWRCPKDGNCEFYDLLKANDVVFEEFGPGIGRNPEQIFGTGISQDQSKCILCKRCVAVCNDVVTAKVLKFRDEDGTNPVVSPTIGLEFDDAGCIFCGQCAKVCPTGTLFETDHIKKVEALLGDSNKEVYVQVSPLVAASLGEEFGYPIGVNTEGKLYRSLELLGFSTIGDISLGENVAVQELGAELVERIQSGGNYPLIATKDPAAVRYIELYRPEFLENISSVKSPQMIQGSLIKHYYGPRHQKQATENIAVVSVLPVTSGKYEATRSEMEVDGVRDVDAVLSVRELARMIKRAGIDYRRIEDKELDNQFASFVGNKAPKTATEETLAYVYNELEQAEMPRYELKDSKGVSLKEYEGSIKETSIQLKSKGLKLNLAVAHGGAAMKKMFEMLDEGAKQYHYIELVATPGGNANGGGMPLAHDEKVNDVVMKRNNAVRQDGSKESPALKPVYEEFLLSPSSKEARKYCHTHYTQKAFTKE
jgi:iron-only hydrogenase group A